jgi:CubicO group peptidase (beta-lactamase class C family)
MELSKEIDEIMEKHKNDFSGVVLVKNSSGIIYSKAFGYAHMGWKIPNNMDTRFDTASITKLFTTVGILQLIDNEDISFDTRVIDFLELKDTTISSEVNVFHLLTHTSGIADDADEEEGEDYEELWKLKPNYSVREAVDFLPQFIHKPAKFKPGEKCNYNNVAFILLGLIIEKVSGMKYREYIQKNIFNRIGMKNTEFCSMDGINNNIAEGYVPIRDENEKIIKYRKNIYSYPPIGTPDSGAYTTANDLDLFITELKNGRLLSENLTKDIFKPKVNYRMVRKYKKMIGYCFEFSMDDSNRVFCMDKGGSNAGVNNDFYYFLDSGITMVILCNNEYPTHLIKYEIMESILK